MLISKSVLLNLKNVFCVNKKKQWNYPICPRSITTKSFSSRATTAYGSWKSGVKQANGKKTATTKPTLRTVFATHHLDMESHTVSGSPRWGSPFPGLRCSSRAWQSDRLSSPPCRRTDLQTEPWTGLCGQRKQRCLNFLLMQYFVLVMRSFALKSAVNGWGGTWRILLLPPEILCPHSERMHDGRRILFNYNEAYVKWCPLKTEKARCNN